MSHVKLTFETSFNKFLICEIFSEYSSFIRSLIVLRSGGSYFESKRYNKFKKDSWFKILKEADD
jgi:hypothetical protein